jgi:hypothetical protein
MARIRNNTNAFSQYSLKQLLELVSNYNFFIYSVYIIPSNKKKLNKQALSEYLTNQFFLRNNTLVLKQEPVEDPQPVQLETPDEDFIPNPDMFSDDNEEQMYSQVASSKQSAVANRTGRKNFAPQTESRKRLGKAGRPVFSEDNTKVLNPTTNRYVKVGGSVDKKLNLSQNF